MSKVTPIFLAVFQNAPSLALSQQPRGSGVSRPGGRSQPQNWCRTGVSVQLRAAGESHVMHLQTTGWFGEKGEFQSTRQFNLQD